VKHQNVARLRSKAISRQLSAISQSEELLLIWLTADR